MERLAGHEPSILRTTNKKNQRTFRTVSAFFGQHTVCSRSMVATLSFSITRTPCTARLRKAMRRLETLSASHSPLTPHIQDLPRSSADPSEDDSEGSDHLVTVLMVVFDPLSVALALPLLLPSPHLGVARAGCSHSIVTALSFLRGHSRTAHIAPLWKAMRRFDG
ncbi:hypothetical protein BLNAU_24283 [Blattamonas nauphoetae]|uniref:Uncharacterized protein n=1 Tax=Blattamonas nauphoetae TaxID=2049346 RepID=A0ABQ9WMY0_9EUKA|nr:hypothetical protein BLNAU_24283 [Blattamonas nauphoetae]